MRVTQCLLWRVKSTHRNAIPFLTKFEWRVRGSKMNVRPLYLPDEVKEHLSKQNYTIEDMFLSERYEKELLKEIVSSQRESDEWQANHDAMQERVKKALDSNRINTLVYLQSNRFEEGEIQAALLTKCQIHRGLAPPVNEIFQSFSFEPGETFELLQRYILRSHVWQTDEDYLPRRFRPHLPIYKHKQEIGIYPNSLVRYLLNDLFRYCQVNFQSSHGTLDSRILTRDHVLNTYYYYRDHRVHFWDKHDLMLSSVKPLPPVSSPSEVADTVNHTLPDISPLSPIIDLKESTVIDQASSDGWSEAVGSHAMQFPHLFSINVALPSMWSDYLEPEADPVLQKHKDAIAVMQCFGQAVATARRCYGDEVFQMEQLPQPLVVQAVSSDSVYFDFITLQLNTLNMRSDAGVKNQVWIDSGHTLFIKQITIRSMLRNTRYRRVNPDTFKRFISLFLYGLDRL